MNMKAEHSAQNNYGFYAVGAGRAERNGEWGKAAELWQKALNFARSRNCRHWAEHPLLFALMPCSADGVASMNAKEFNQRYAVGSHFIYQPCKVLRGGTVVKTIGEARDLNSSTIVEINVEQGRRPAAN
ncbi:ANR family transcriptional regulator [Erwinia tracheiphila]|uniref:ANR family transcriptional regulator n=1 Tax=Erwinia tracheiphila TaxID=65700 RepID=UPI000A7599D2